jgi:hypothetical protein
VAPLGNILCNYDGEGGVPKFGTVPLPLAPPEVS